MDKITKRFRCRQKAILWSNMHVGFNLRTMSKGPAIQITFNNGVTVKLRDKSLKRWLMFYICEFKEGLV